MGNTCKSLAGSFQCMSKPTTIKKKRKIKASILLHSAFFIVQRSHPYMTTGESFTETHFNVLNRVSPKSYLGSAVCKDLLSTVTGFIPTYFLIPSSLKHC